MKTNLSRLLDRCLSNKSPSKALLVASSGCFLGSFLIIVAFQIYADSCTLFLEKAGGYITLNKKVEGGLLQNLDSKDKAFTSAEITQVSELPGVLDIAGFSRNHFPVTVHIWPTGKVGLGVAARADLFFESIPDRFLDQQPDNWQWDENQSFVPIIVPKFYLDLWNFGLAPARSEYPALSLQSATSMPIEIFIGDNQSVRMIGKFVAFSKRINSVLVPLNFLKWANSKFGMEEKVEFYFLWKNGGISGPPVSHDQLKKIQREESSEIIVSKITEPEKQFKWNDEINYLPREEGPARLIIKLSNSSKEDFFLAVKKLEYETNQEQPTVDWLSKTAKAIIWAAAGLGSLLSLLSIATFTSCFRLIVVQSADSARNLINLGFSNDQISLIYKKRFDRLFGIIMAISLVAVFTAKALLRELAMGYGLETTGSLSWQTWAGAIFYAILFLAINHGVIGKSVQSFGVARDI